MKNYNISKANEKCKQLYLERIEKYNLNPRLCKQCNNPIPYDDMIHGKVFCTHSCSATYSNERRIRNKLAKPTNTRLCLICNKPTPSSESMFCEPNGRCDCIYTMNKTRSAGKIPSKESVRRYLVLTRGYKCEGNECGISDWHGSKIPLESHHIDGNYKNNNDNNLLLLCPNCHSITKNFRGRNRYHGRGYRSKMNKDLNIITTNTI